MPLDKREESQLRTKSPKGMLEDQNMLNGEWSQDRELQEVLRKGLQKACLDQERPPRRPKFTDLVFTRQFSAFDRQNETSANSPFHGFFTLFWMGVALFVAKIGAENWRATGSILGTNEIMKGMGKDLVIMLAADGLMCGLTAVTWVIQWLVFHGAIRWDRLGWIIQTIWQIVFLAGVIGLPLLRPWPWTHVTYFVLHGITMLMKQHTYSFYNGHLSVVYRKYQYLASKLKQLDQISPIYSLGEIENSYLPNKLDLENVSTFPYNSQPRLSLSASSTPEDDLKAVSTYLDSNSPFSSSTACLGLTPNQHTLFKSILAYEIAYLSEELKGKATTNRRAYPYNLALVNFTEFIVLPTLVYELEYPRSESIHWGYVAEKGAATIGIIIVMIIVSQAFIYPVIISAIQMKDAGIPLGQRLAQFPWMLLDLIFPFMMEYLLAWYLIWESVLNIFAELTYFADRSFYGAWWNSVSWDQFARDWNRPVHNFLLRHVYHSSISSMKVGRHTATIITFLLSACIHELVMWCIFKKLRGYLLFLQMCQLPLVKLHRTKYFRGRKNLGNLAFWLGLFLGPSLLCSLYVIL